MSITEALKAKQTEGANKTDMHKTRSLFPRRFGATMKSQLKIERRGEIKGRERPKERRRRRDDDKSWGGGGTGWMGETRKTRLEQARKKPTYLQQTLKLKPLPR